MKRNTTSDNTVGLGGGEQEEAGREGIKVLFLTSFLKALQKSNKERFFSPPVYSSESEKPNFSRNGTSFFQVRTVPGQRSFSEKIVVTNCQKDQYKA